MNTEQITGWLEENINEDVDLLKFDDGNESDKSNNEFVENTNHNSNSEESDEECTAAGCKKNAQNDKTIEDAWTLFFPDNILEQIVKYTNKRLDKFRSSYARERDVLPTNLIEIKSVIGLLYLAGITF
ncbi:uncharacterized protein LOC132932566 [Metopolophium dirhodum]|uniref:uncharacterized protein LOC132932566 n=1 Tax=Metopolophium dirhodum TaxID=44670 RepID=UPI00298FF1FC|nr:uncharacterized protein LOC132932566 [Metopolophium dirhodum]